jgi:hypothetical protein
MTIESNTQARICWTEPGGNQGHGAWLPLAQARVIARAYKFDEPHRQVWVESQAGHKERVEWAESGA